jgi:hypothetical protein
MNQAPDNNPRGVVTGIMITLFAALVSTLFFAVFFTLAYVKKMPYGKPQAMLLQTASILVTVGITQYLSRMIQGNRLSFLQGFLGGWMASLVLAMLISSFYTIFSKFTGQPLLPQGGFAIVLMLYSGLGIFISLILALLFKKD